MPDMRAGDSDPEHCVGECQTEGNINECPSVLVTTPTHDMILFELSEGKDIQSWFTVLRTNWGMPQLALHVHIYAEIASFSGPVIQKLVPYTARSILFVYG
jgi:hypothetical protein